VIAAWSYAAIIALYRIVGKPGALLQGDSRRLYLGQGLVFSVEWQDTKKDELVITDPAGNTRMVVPPWRQSNELVVARLSFNGLGRQAVEGKDRQELFQSATTLGRLLFEVLFDSDGVERLRRAMIPGQTRPLITILSSDDLLLSLPWELMHYKNEFTSVQELVYRSATGTNPQGSKPLAGG
jgi:hypothetical protein